MSETQLQEVIEEALEQSLNLEEEETPQVTNWPTPEAYRQATNRRFRMTPDELNVFGRTPEGRQNAFIARRDAGLLPS